MHGVVYPHYPQALQICTDDANDHPSVFDTSKAHFRTLFFPTDATDVQIQICSVFNFQLDQYVFEVPFHLAYMATMRCAYLIPQSYWVKLKRIQDHVLRPGFLDMTSWSAPWFLPPSKQFLVGVNMVILNVGGLACNISDMNIMNQWQQKRGACGNGSASMCFTILQLVPPFSTLRGVKLFVYGLCRIYI